MTAGTPAPEALRTVFGACPSSVVAVCGMAAGERVGMAMSTFVPVSLDPPLVAVCIQDGSRTWPVLREVPVLGVSVLAHPHEHAARALAARSGDRFAGVATSVDDGAVHINDSVAQLACSIEGETVAGDHLIVLLRVHAAHYDADADPLVFHRSGFTGVAAPARPEPSRPAGEPTTAGTASGGTNGQERT